MFISFSIIIEVADENSEECLKTYHLSYYGFKLKYSYIFVTTSARVSELKRQLTARRLNVASFKFV